MKGFVVVYSIFAVLFFIGCLMFGVGLLGRLGTEGIKEVDANIASTLALLATYSFLLLYFSSFSEIAKIFESICGGVPYLRDIVDFGSMKGVFTNDPLRAAMSFFDAVILSVIIDLLSFLPLSQGNAAGKTMVKIFTGVILSLISLVILNFVIKNTATYKWIVSVIGGAISLVSLGTLPISIITMFNKNTSGGLVTVGFLALFSKSKTMGIIRDAFYKAVIYVLGIFLLENYFGTLATGVSVLTNLVIAFGPAFIIIIGIVLMFKSLKA